MIPIAQHIAIAEACGWEWVETAPGIFTWKQPDGELLESQWWCGKDEHSAPFAVPNYTDDLNAMHLAEMSLTKQQRSRYRQDYLEKKHGREAPHTTAAQRAEAFLRAIDKWEGDKP